MYFRFTFIWLHWQTANKKSMLDDFLAPNNYFCLGTGPKAEREIGREGGRQRERASS